MSEPTILKRVIHELDTFSDQIREEELEQLADRIQKADRVFIGGVGRSGFSARAFANRLMHLGLTVYFLGETTTPAIRKGDLLVINSGSGETDSLKVLAAKAKKNGAGLALVTIFRDSSIGKLADTVVALPGSSPKKDGKGVRSFQPMGNAYEQMSWLVFDTVVMILMNKLHESSEEMFKRHANLE